MYYKTYSLRGLPVTSIKMYPLEPDPSCYPSRRMVAGLLGAGLSMAASRSVFAAPTSVERALLFGFAPFEFARLRTRALRQNAINAINHRRTLSDHTARTITTPNNDTLYSSAWLDLSLGPQLIELPETGARYISVMLMDPFTDNFQILGTRTTGTRGGKFLLVGPDWTGTPPEAARVIVCPVHDVWLLVRLLVDGPSDLAQAVQIQSLIRLTPSAGNAPPMPSIPPLPSVATEIQDPQIFLDTTTAILARMPTSHPQARRGRALFRQRFLAGEFTQPIARLRQTLVGDDSAALNITGQWSVSSRALGRFGRDDVLRAKTALTGFGALLPEEAMYFGVCSDQSGQGLAGNNSYRMLIPSSGIPTNGFWSLSLYEIDPSGRLFFTPNALNRFVIGNRTPGLQSDRGQIEILIGSNSPTAERQANWLPAPKGPFQLTLRAYLPKPIMLRHRWQPPVIMKV
jgi:hypothetical protein